MARRTPIEKDYIARPPKWLVERATTTGNDMLLWSEAKWQREVVKALRRFGFMLVYHTWNSRNSPPGFPDIVAWKPGRLLTWELKRENGKTTTAQEEWLAAFKAHGAETGVYRPSQWDEVLACLAR